MRHCVGFITGTEPQILHHVDATAAMGILNRSGVGNLRHLSTRILWTQQRVAMGEIVIKKVNTLWNVSDLGTKGLSRERMLLLLVLTPKSAAPLASASTTASLRRRC